MGKLLEQFGFDDGCSGALLGSKAVEAIMELNGSFDSGVKDTQNQFQHNFQ